MSNESGKVRRDLAREVSPPLSAAVLGVRRHERERSREQRFGAGQLVFIDLWRVRIHEVHTSVG